MALAESLGVRTGMEDTLWMDEGKTVSASNLALVSRIASLASTIGRPLSTADETRRSLGLLPSK